MSNPESDRESSDSNILVRRIRDACANSFGVLESRFLCQSISVLEPKSPNIVAENSFLDEVLKRLQTTKSGCAVVINSQGLVSGIFTERDCLLKVVLASLDLATTPVSSVMTPNPVCERADATIAFALNLMSVGGFRHIPIVDDKQMPIGVISVKDVVDYIVARMTEDLLAFETIES